MTPSASSALTRRQIGAADRPTCSVSCWADARPSSCSPFRILRSILSMRAPQLDTQRFVTSVLEASVLISARPTYRLSDAVQQHGQNHHGNARFKAIARAQALNRAPHLTTQAIGTNHGRN